MEQGSNSKSSLLQPACSTEAQCQLQSCTDVKNHRAIEKCMGAENKAEAPD